MSETSLVDLPLFEGVDAGEVRMTVPAAGSGATRSPDEAPTVTVPAAADAVTRPLVRARSPTEDPGPAAGAAKIAVAKAPRTRARDTRTE